MLPWETLWFNGQQMLNVSTACKNSFQIYPATLDINPYIKHSIYLIQFVLPCQSCFLKHLENINDESAIEQVNDFSIIITTRLYWVISNIYICNYISQIINNLLTTTTVIWQFALIKHLFSLNLVILSVSYQWYLLAQYHEKIHTPRTLIAGIKEKFEQNFQLHLTHVMNFSWMLADMLHVQ